MGVWVCVKCVCMCVCACVCVRVCVCYGYCISMAYHTARPARSASVSVCWNVNKGKLSVEYVHTGSNWET